jgi:sulfatase maturation enzyme AslB (radical SAM superfamily)
VHFNVAGNITPCCDWTGDDQGIVIDSSDPLLSTGMQGIRDSVLAGNHIPGCARCYHYDAQGISSTRTWFNQLYGRPTEPALRYVKFHLGNLCNMTCRMCWSGSSSKWAHDELALGRTPMKPTRHSLTDTAIDLSQLDKLDFRGGEPSLEQATIHSLLDGVVAAQGTLSGLHVQITTNGLVMLEPQLMAKLAQCRQVDISISMDGIGAVNDYQRTGCDWSTLRDNLLEYQHKASGNTVLTILTAWSLLNINQAQTLLSWIAEHLPRFRALADTVWSPAELCARNLPTEIKHTIKARLQAWTELDHVDWVARSKVVIASVLDTEPNRDRAKVRAHIQRLDLLRSEDFAMIDPEVYHSLWR